MGTDHCTEERISSLRTRLTEATAEERGRLLQGLAEELRTLPWSAVEPFLEDLLKQAEESHHNETFAGVLRALSELARLRGDLVAARQHADRLLEFATRNGDGRYEGAARYLQGRVCEDSGEYLRAQQFYEQAQAVWRRIEFVQGCRSVLNQLGNLMVLQGAPGAALRYYLEFAALRLEEQTAFDRAVNQLNIGWAHVQLGNWEDAAENLYRAIAVCEQHGLNAVRFSAVNCLGEMFLKRDKPDRAVEMFSRVVEAGRRGETEPETMRDALVNVGAACLQMGDLAGAERAFREGIECCKKGVDPQSLSLLRRHMAELAMMNGRIADAESLAREALEAAQGINARREIGEALRVLGLVVGGRGDVDQAVSYFERAVKCFEGAEECYELGRARYQYGRFLSQAGKTQEAVAQLRHAERIFRNLSVVSQAAEVSRLLFKLETREDNGLALLAAVADLLALGLEPVLFLERVLRLLRESMGFESAIVVTDSRPLFVEGDMNTERSCDLQRDCAGEPKVTETSLCFPVRFGGRLLAAVHLERSTPRRVGFQPFLLQALSGMIASCIHELAAAPAAYETGLSQIPGLKYRGVLSRDRRVIGSLKVVARVASAPVPVLIRGESGTGKELVAKALHESGPRAGRPFVAVNCAAMPETLLEAEFFGVEKGAATGVVARKGKFEVANGGSIFLDEVGDMSPALQAKLLRVLQEKEFERVGGHRSISVDVRVIAATNQNLEERIERGLFRRDLYYRLNAVEIELPPLRERREDIPDLVRYFINKSSREFGRRVSGVEPEVMKVLVSYSWPGNVRELQNVIERAVVLCDSGELRISDLPPELRGAEQAQEDSSSFRTARRMAQEAAVSDLERTSLVEYLEKSGWNVSKAAQMAGYSRAQFYRLMKKHGIARAR